MQLARPQVLSLHRALYRKRVLLAASALPSSQLRLAKKLPKEQIVPLGLCGVQGHSARVSGLLTLRVHVPK